MDPRLYADLAGMPDLLDAVQDYAHDIVTGLDDRPVTSPFRPPRAERLPARGAGGAATLRHFGNRWAPGFSASAGPRYLGFVTGGATPAAVAGDWLTSVFDQNTITVQDSAASDLERETVRWIRDLLHLPDDFTGAFVTGATMSNLTGLALAREWLGDQLGVSVSTEGVAALGPVVVLSGAAHSTVSKALSVLGLGRDSLRPVALLPGRDAVDVDALRAALREQDGRPVIVVANAGTVNTGDFDDLEAIADLREEFPFWLHVDGAFGAFAALSPSHAHLVAGLGRADSVCVDLHKWLNVPYDSGLQLSRHQELQARVFGNASAYIGVPGTDPDFVHLTPESSRRLRALPAWFTLCAYGRDGHREIVERTIALARRVGQQLAEIDGVELLAPVRLNIVCLKVPGDPADLARRIAETGVTFLTPTVHHGTPALRLAFSNWRTSEADADRIVEVFRHLLSGG
ncbi:pyridoxal phosphate-dependent decarboxylase family protein [Nocardioides sp. NPDC101246]|uniref:pyridoxal phosphate-dependent decarboxylase family protein n=1 Tax=Nocardioides sp. NPDC101246 TaxID=3364336 RepID=UPI0037F5C095